MPKYHINPETGRPNICRAKEGNCRYRDDSGEQLPHFPSKTEAREHYEKIQKAAGNSLPRLKKQKTVYDVHELLKRKAVVEKLRNAGFTVNRGAELNERLIHTPSRKKPVPNVGEVWDAGKSIGSPDKSDKALWLSPETIRADGSISTAWDDWCDREDWHLDGMGEPYVTELDNEAVILTLDDYNAQYVNEVLRGEPYDIPHDAQTYNDKLQFFLEHNKMPTVDWELLRDSGVDAVRVDGWHQRGHFYGWDCDSVAVLVGKSVVGFQNRDKE